jgi:hypothetical protein
VLTKPNLAQLAALDESEEASVCLNNSIQIRVYIMNDITCSKHLITNDIKFDGLQPPEIGKRAAGQNVFHFARAMRKTVGLSHGVGAHGMRETPVPIPNTAVKPHSGYNTWGFTPGKIARCQIIETTTLTGWFFFNLIFFGLFSRCGKF